MPQNLSTPPRRRSNRRRQRSLALPLLGAAVLFLIILLRPWTWFGSGVHGNPAANQDAPEFVTVDLLPINEYSRPGTPLEEVNGVVVHYVGNPNTTAQQNRSYFASLAQTGETSASSHYIIGMDGAIIQCVPLTEIAYCSGVRNADTISIECCHPDDTGQFTQETMDSLRTLLHYLIDLYNLDQEDIIRHYDVTGKECPRYFVQHPEEWESFRASLFE